jgi:hypothetical protein
MYVYFPGLQVLLLGPPTLVMKSYWLMSQKRDVVSVNTIQMILSQVLSAKEADSITYKPVSSEPCDIC